jgi:hypothetical protein
MNNDDLVELNRLYTACYNLSQFQEHYEAADQITITLPPRVATKIRWCLEDVRPDLKGPVFPASVFGIKVEIAK